MLCHSLCFSLSYSLAGSTQPALRCVCSGVSCQCAGVTQRASVAEGFPRFISCILKRDRLFSFTAMQLQLPHIPDEASEMSLLLKSQILVYRREFFRDYNPALTRLSEIQQKTVNLI